MGLEHRTLCRLGEYFYVSAVACPDDLGVVLAGSGATGNNDLGQVLLLRPGPDAPDPESDLLIATLATDATAVDAMFGPDGSQVAVGFADLGEGVGPVVYGADGALRYALDLDAAGEVADDIGFGRVGHSADGRLLACGNTETGSVLVAEASTGDAVLRAEGAAGAVALDDAGELLAHACPEGRVALRDVGSGALLSTWETGLTSVNTLAFAPGASGLVAAGDDRPTACVMTVRAGKVTGASLVPVADSALTMDATAPVATYSAKASWTERGPLVFVADDELAVLFDASDGRIRWTSTAGPVAASFTPDGRTLVTSGMSDGVVEAWFLG
ncbi:WD40 repeat domain-containing protein [Actinomadura gamaensis]|uniref:WD40 repeat domain-containing protein n=1 Tax=Actinomadura gamaensis TaxID=1763541 RepID=A0ABV9TWB2_9ACTN